MTGARKVKLRPSALPHVRLLLAIRHQRHWTQAQLADELGVTRNTISRWELGEKEPHVSWVKLIRALAVPCDSPDAA